MRRIKAKSRAVIVLEEKLAAREELVHDLTRKLTVAENEIKGLRDDVSSAERAYTVMCNAVSDLRKSMDDMRGQRDEAQQDAKEWSGAFRGAEKDLARALGWIDAKMDKGPRLSDPDFQEILR